MKKAIALFMALMLLVACSACSNKEDSSKPTDSGSSEAVETAKVSPQALYIPGAVITFGRYEQDNNLDNGPEPIEWLVLDVQDGKALLLSRYGLDAKPYHSKGAGVTWEFCSLRAWLNNDFLKAAFSIEEQSAILVSEVDNSDEQSYDYIEVRTITHDDRAPGGNNTQDQIFLFSYMEANRYLDVMYTVGDDSNIKYRVSPTKYAIQNGANTDIEYMTGDGRKAGWWWLRSPGSRGGLASEVEYNGALSSRYTDHEDGIVRPAFWLDLSSNRE